MAPVRMVQSIKKKNNNNNYNNNLEEVWNNEKSKKLINLESPSSLIDILLLNNSIKYQKIS